MAETLARIAAYHQRTVGRLSDKLFRDQSFRS